MSDAYTLSLMYQWGSWTTGRYVPCRLLVRSVASRHDHCRGSVFFAVWVALRINAYTLIVTTVTLSSH